MALAEKSESFVADLPLLSDEALAKLYTWGKSTCVRFDVHMNKDGLILVAQRKKSGTCRDHMRLLRTNLQNWGVELPVKQTGWLRIVPAEEVAKATSTGDPLPEMSEQSPEKAEGSETNATPPGTPPRASMWAPPMSAHKIGVYLPLPPCLLTPLPA